MKDKRGNDYTDVEHDTTDMLCYALRSWISLDHLRPQHHTTFHIDIKRYCLLLLIMQLKLRLWMKLYAKWCLEGSGRWLKEQSERMEGESKIRTKIVSPPPLSICIQKHISCLYIFTFVWEKNGFFLMTMFIWWKHNDVFITWNVIIVIDCQDEYWNCASKQVKF